MIKLFEQFNNEQEIHDICKKYKINNYTINPDGSIDVDGGVYLSQKTLTEIPLNFNKVSGNFLISDNKLTSLKGCPKEVTGDFSCSRNKITNLVGGPHIVGGEYLANNNPLLNSLEGSPTHVGSDFNLYSNNKLTSLKGCPLVVYNLDISDCQYLKIVDVSVEVKRFIILSNSGLDTILKNNSVFDYTGGILDQKYLKVIFEHGIDYNIFNSDGSVNEKMVKRLYKDFDVW